MTARREEASVEAIKRARDADGAVHVRHLPEPVSAAMQAIVDNCEFRCLHVQAARELPASALDKLCIRGVPGIWCSAPTCVADMAQHVAVWRGVRVDDSCVMCGRAQTAYRTVFTDEAAGLSMVAWLCRDELARLAGWVGLP